MSQNTENNEKTASEGLKPAARGKRVDLNGRLVTEGRFLEIATLSDAKLIERLQLVCDFVIALERVEKEFGWRQRERERTYWPLLYEDYCAEAIRRGLL